MPSCQGQSKDWWVPIRIGLILGDRHRKSLKGAVWLFLYLTAHADRETGQLLRKYATVAKDMNTSHKTVQRWMNILRADDYIKTQRLIHGFHIQITKWRQVLSKKEGPQNDRSWVSRVDTPNTETGHFEHSDGTNHDRPSQNRGVPNSQYGKSFANQSPNSVQSKESIKESNKHIYRAFEEDWKKYIRPGGNLHNAWQHYLATVGKDINTQRPIFLKKMNDYVASVSDPQYYKHGERFFREWEDLVIDAPPQRVSRVSY
jgi:hypothetical protein